MNSVQVGHRHSLSGRASHSVVASASRNVATPQVDCIIALSYCELLASTRGIRTVWDGLAYWTLTELVPEAREWLGIPEDPVIGYCMVLGLPKIPFQRTVQHATPGINWIKDLSISPRARQRSRRGSRRSRRCGDARGCPGGSAKAGSLWRCSRS